MTHGPCTRALAAVLALTSLAGCMAPHVTLHAPDRAAPDAERVAAYRALAPMRLYETRVTFFDRMFLRNVRYIDSLELANGTLVYYADDLLPLVPDDSVVAIEARAAARSHRNQRILSLGGFGVFAAGIALGALGLSNDPGTGARRGLVYTGLGLVTVGLSMRFGRRYASRNREEHELRAFMQYDEALRVRLGVCETGCGEPERFDRW